MTAQAAPRVVKVQPAEPHLTDLGNAERLIRRHGAGIRWVPAWRTWLVWNPALGIWRRDEDGEVARLCHETIRALYLAAADYPDKTVGRNWSMHALKSESRRSIEAMAAVAATLDGASVSHDRLDADPWSINAAGTLVDLRTGDGRPAAPTDFCSKRTAAPYDQEAQCPLWTKFVSETLGGDDERIEFMQRFLGSCLTGSTRDQVFMVFHGAGSNGKTTLVERVRRLMGDYAVQADASTFLSRRDDGQPRNDLARLVGARLVSCSESGESRRLDEGLVKQATGGEPLTCRRLYEEPFEFVPQFKIVLSTNHRPEIRGGDHGMWRRVREMPFDVRVPDDKQDKLLGEKLDAEAPGILAWLVRGCLAWLTDGLPKSAAVEKAVAEYRVDQDVLGPFIEERCTTGEFEIANSKLYKSYADWCETRNEKSLTAAVFGRRMTDRGFAAYRTKRERGWKGVTLLSEVENGDGNGAGDGNLGSW